ncbi:MAG: hypothetical protein UX09_C0009G0018 [Candidatus Uhrbacteria bacterium GW2011_GWE2_45_35]|nr:MAG: hypothetical protein UX09_C0009G0018 [Candidatus Uhrbacteria bacterium GW2011_GWE2_45_35]HCU31905.1 hypothetical protein [Candidatus Uhrbacteria bacterium]
MFFARSGSCVYSQLDSQSCVKTDSQSGTSLILPVLLLGVTGLSIFLAMAATTTSSVALILSQRDAVEARVHLFGCLDEYLVHLPANPDFSPVELLVFDEVCSTVVSTPIEGQREIVVSNTIGQVTRQLTVLVQLDPFDFVEITEP